VLLCLGRLAFGAEDIELNIPFYPQIQSYWCWAATAQTLAETKGVKYSQTEVVGLTEAPDKADCKGNEAEFNQIGHVDKALRACGVACHGRAETLTRDEVVKELEEKEPIVIRVIPEGYETAHFVVIYGVKGDQFLIWDPDHGGRKLSVTRQEMTKEVGRWVNTVTLGAPLRPNPAHAIRPETYTGSEIPGLGKTSQSKLAFTSNPFPTHLGLKDQKYLQGTPEMLHSKRKDPKYYRDTPEKLRLKPSEISSEKK
jgi:hypothetical protein